jgi:hypothetical protein
MNFWIKVTTRKRCDFLLEWVYPSALHDRSAPYVEAARDAVTKIGLAPGASTSRLRFESDLKEAVADADNNESKSREGRLRRNRALPAVINVLAADYHRILSAGVISHAAAKAGELATCEVVKAAEQA